ncbi:MAG TPA: alpha/beta hydrolase, partial [Acidimicrobiales bacterium]|nr:alpha/beta hydrolase [Acidimicrobiales bacterium]
AATTRLGQLATFVPSRSVQAMLPVPQGRGRPGSIQRWAAAEMRRHDPRALMEAGHAIGTYDASRWIGRIDVPTTVLVTTGDRAIQPTTQLAMARAIPNSEIHLTDHGHVVCARPEFAPPLVDACTSVAERV